MLKYLIALLVATIMTPAACSATPPGHGGSGNRGADLSPGVNLTFTCHVENKFGDYMTGGQIKMTVETFTTNGDPGEIRDDKGVYHQSPYSRTDYPPMVHNVDIGAGRFVHMIVTCELHTNLVGFRIVCLTRVNNVPIESDAEVIERSDHPLAIATCSFLHPGE